MAALDQGIDARISAVNWATLFCPSIGGARIHMEQFTEGDLKACTLFWALTRTLDEDWPCRETAKTSQDCCDKVHSRRCSSASSRQSSQISAQAGPRHSFTRKLLMQSIQNRLCLPQTPLCPGRLFVFPRKPLHLLTVCFFRADRCCPPFSSPKRVVQYCGFESFQALAT